MTSGPIPTRLVFLNDLQTLPPGSKVRFLGWYSVTHYSIATGTLRLQHAYPPPPQVCPVALVDVNLLLSTMKSTDTRVGEWVNVTGYVEEENRGLGRKEWRGRGDRGNVGAVRVQAVMLWSAGSVNLGQYETAASRRMSTESENRPLR